MKTIHGLCQYNFIGSASSKIDLGTRLIDINGDGLPDVLHYYYGESLSSVWLNTGDGWETASSTIWTIPTHIAVNFSSLQGVDAGVRFDDFNGDGLVDIAHARDGGSGDSKLYFNKGDGSWATTTPSGMEDFVSESGVDQGVRVGDFNGDGLADFAKQGSGCTDVKLYINSNAAGTFTSGCSAMPYDFNSGGATPYDLGTRYADFNGDGFVDFINSYSGSSSGVSLKQGDLPDMLETATDKLGATTRVEYKGTPEYSPGVTRKNKEIPFVLQTVQEIGVDDGFGTTASTTYEYAGGDYYFNNCLRPPLCGLCNNHGNERPRVCDQNLRHQGNWTNIIQRANTATTSQRSASPTAPKSTMAAAISTQRRSTNGPMSTSAMTATS